MDGFGLSDQSQGNAVRAANTPRLDQFFQEYAHTELSASGLDVGLPEGQMGNSEVGHTNIGAGRVVFQDLPRITKSIADGDFFTNPAYNCLPCFSWPRIRASPGSISTPFWTGGMSPPPPAPTSWPRRWRSAGRSAWARSPR